MLLQWIAFISRRCASGFCLQLPSSIPWSDKTRESRLASHMPLRHDRLWAGLPGLRGAPQLTYGGQGSWLVETDQLRKQTQSLLGSVESAPRLEVLVCTGWTSGCRRGALCVRQWAWVGFPMANRTKPTALSSSEKGTDKSTDPTVHSTGCGKGGIRIRGRRAKALEF